MSAILLDGQAAARDRLDRLRPDIERLARVGVTPRIVALRANSDPGTDWYARAQARLCAAHGVGFEVDDLGPRADERRILDAVARRNADPAVHGLLVFLPLPPGVDAARAQEAVDPAKDAEGMHPVNLGRLLAGREDGPLPCTATAAVDLAVAARPDLAGARALVIGRSAIVGKPVALLLLNRHATVTIAHTRSDVRAAAMGSDVIVAAAGASGAAWRSYGRRRDQALREGRRPPPPPPLGPLVTADIVPRGAVVVDVGENELPIALDDAGHPIPDAAGRPGMRRAGDVDFEKVREVAGWITPPKGGVGPLTNARLLENVVRAAIRSSG